MALRSHSYRWLFWLLAISGFAIDQFTKNEIFFRLYNDGNGGRIEVIPGAFSLVTSFSNQEDPGGDWLAPLRTISGTRLPHVNRGALFGIGQDANFLFGLVSVAAAGAIIFWSTRPASARHGLLCFALGLILAGTLGNLYDRIVFHGVRDFLYWYKWVDWPVFNIADCCLVVGAGLLLVEALFIKVEPVAELPAVQALADVHESPSNTQVTSVG